MQVGYVARRGNEISLENRETETRKTEEEREGETHWPKKHTKGTEGQRFNTDCAVNGAL